MLLRQNSTYLPHKPSPSSCMHSQRQKSRKHKLAILSNVSDSLLSSLKLFFLSLLWRDTISKRPPSQPKHRIAHWLCYQLWCCVRVHSDMLHKSILNLYVVGTTWKSKTCTLIVPTIELIAACVIIYVGLMYLLTIHLSLPSPT